MRSRFVIITSLKWLQVHNIHYLTKCLTCSHFDSDHALVSRESVLDCYRWSQVRQRLGPMIGTRLTVDIGVTSTYFIYYHLGYDLRAGGGDLNGEGGMMNYFSKDRPLYAVDGEQWK